MQLVDGHFHGRFGEHLRAHVEYQTRVEDTSRHVCGWSRMISERVCYVSLVAVRCGAERGAVSVCVYVCAGASPVVNERLSEAISAAGRYLYGGRADVI